MAKRDKMNQDFPIWFDGKSINEALFCEDFLQERKVIFTDRAFFTPDGRVTDDISLRGQVYAKLKYSAVTGIPQKIGNIMEVLKLEAQVDDFPPKADRIHVSNGTLWLDGTITESKQEIVRNRLPVSYSPDAPEPVVWLKFWTDCSIKRIFLHCRSLLVIA